MDERYPDGLVNGDQSGCTIKVDGGVLRTGDPVEFYGGYRRRIIAISKNTITLDAPIPTLPDNAGIWFNG